MSRSRSTLAGTRVIALAGALLLALATAPAVAQEPPVVTLMTHDSFFLPDDAFAAFEAATGAEVRVLQAGDAGAMVNQAILTADRPLADVLYGIDNTFLSRALDAGIFRPYRSPELESVPAALVVDAAHRVTPIDRADVCLNVDVAALEERGLAAPTALADLIDPAYRSLLVVQDPSTSSPGLSFLLATVATFGEDESDGWRAFWAGLRENDVAIASGWEEAYSGRFSGGSGEGDRPIVVSYATSPVAEVAFGPDPEAETSPTAAVAASCFEQIEFAGILEGTSRPDLAGRLIDHLLSEDVQAALPLSMFVFPVRDGVEVPAVFERHALLPPDPIRLPAAVIDGGRERWIREWTETVLR